MIQVTHFKHGQSQFDIQDMHGAKYWFCVGVAGFQVVQTTFPCPKELLFRVTEDSKIWAAESTGRNTNLLISPIV